MGVGKNRGPLRSLSTKSFYVMNATSGLPCPNLSHGTCQEGHPGPHDVPNGMMQRSFPRFSVRKSFLEVSYLHPTVCRAMVFLTPSMGWRPLHLPDRRGPPRPSYEVPFWIVDYNLSAKPYQTPKRRFCKPSTQPSLHYC